MVPVIERLAAEVPVPLSIDTYKSAVARPALEAGATMLNDQWGLKQDHHLAQLAAEFGNIQHKECLYEEINISG